MKKLILAVVLTAVSVTSAFAQTVAVRSQAWYHAEVTVVDTNGYIETHGLDQSGTVFFEPQGKYRITVNPIGHIFDEDPSITDDVSALFEIKGSVFNPYIQKVQDGVPTFIWTVQ